jgi:putative spermidine/putrescine transport system ATP-binding protein
VRGTVLDSMITGSLTKLYVNAPAAGSDPVVLCYPTSSAAAPHPIGADVTLHWSGSDAVAVPEAA